MWYDAKFSPFKGNRRVVQVKRNNKTTLVTYQKVYSSVNNKLTGYVVVSNKWYYSIWWVTCCTDADYFMIAIIFFVAISYVW